MLGKPVTIEAAPRDGAPVTLRFSIDGTRIVSAEPAGVVVMRGGGCDDVTFFSSADAARSWMSTRGVQAELYPLDEAVARGARIFGRYFRGL